jgi:hypothetical protein
MAGLGVTWSEHGMGNAPAHCGTVHGVPEVQRMSIVTRSPFSTGVGACSDQLVRKGLPASDGTFGPVRLLGSRLA